MGGIPGSFAAIFLVGGRARRLGGIAKSELVVGGSTILERMLAACEPASTRVVVGARPSDAGPLPADVVEVVEDPPGSGPAWAVASAMPQIPDGLDRVLVLPGDLPFLCREAVGLLLRTADEFGPEGGAIFCDDAGRRQWLCGVWPTQALRFNAMRVEPGDRSKRLFEGIAVDTVIWESEGPPPWFDCDTPEDLEQARSWADEMK